MSSVLSKLLKGSFICFIISSFAEETCENGTKSYRMAVRHIESGGVGYDQGYTTLEFFLAPDPSQVSILPFVDFRGHAFDNGKFAANAGLGIRALTNCRVYGANIYYDYRNTRHQHYNQIGLGFETLGIRWDFRANGYIPVGSKKSSIYDSNTTSVAIFETFQGNQALLRQTLTTKGKVQFAMTGVNAEIAFHILKNENIDLYAAAGPYYYNYRSKQAIGGEARLGARIYEYLSLDVINSYDTRFHENFQGSIGINIPLGPRPKISQNKKFKTCSSPCLLAQRLVQDVERQEIIVVDKLHKTYVSEKTSAALNPFTEIPYFFVFVDNTSSSLGTYESPYPTLVLAEEKSNPGDIIYVFPGDGTTKGMDSGITLKINQQFWGSAISHVIQTTDGTILIPAQSSAFPSIANMNMDTNGNVITLANHNAISGFTLTSALINGIYGVNLQNLELASCTIENSALYAINATFAGDSSIFITNNQFLNNVNGVNLTLDGSSEVICSNNTFTGQTSVSNTPIEILADSNSFTAHFENNIFTNNAAGSIRFNLTDVVDADILALTNTITNNGTGSQASLASSIALLSNGTIDHCAITLLNNTFSENESNALYLHTSGEMTTLAITASNNTISDNGGSALVLATPVTNLTLLATENFISRCNDNGIAIISSGSSSTGNITISNNTITDIGNASNGVAINQDFTTLNLTILNNDISNCEGTGIISYSSTGIDSLTLSVSDNTINNCQNLSSNAASGIDFEQFTNFVGSITNNTLSGNTGTAVLVGSTLPGPTACLTLNGNASSTDYLLTNPGDGVFNLSPCDADTGNAGIINTAGTIDTVQSCPDATPCPP